MKSNSVKFYRSIDLPTTPDNASRAPHLHNDYEILFVYSVENASFNIRGLRYPLKSFDPVFINPAIIHNPTISYDRDYERCGLYFSEDKYCVILAHSTKSATSLDCLVFIVFLPLNSRDLKVAVFDDFWQRRTRVYIDTPSENLPKSA